MEANVKTINEDPIRLSVFVGSPKRGLEKVRRKIIDAILNAGHIPDGMELWAAMADPTLLAIANKLNLCDIHVVILGSSYGQLLENEKISFTEWEYVQSRNAGRPIISFLLDEKAIQDAWQINPPFDEVQEKSYLKLWNELRSKSICKLYKNAKMDGIEGDVINSINQVIENKTAHLFGWIRAESKASKLTAALQDNAFLMRIMDRVVRFRTTGGRLDKEHNAKKAAADMFWDTMMSSLVRKNYLDVFIESGSSLAYVSEALEKRLERHNTWNISTNNALSLLQLLLFTDLVIRRNPPVAPDPDDPYGAIFTSKCKQAHEEPPIKPRKLFQNEMEAILEIIDLLKSKEKNQIFLATASGWDFGHKVVEFHGPHVGSHPNMLFKRAIFMTNQPVVLFLSRHKVDPVFHESRFKCRTDKEKFENEMRYCYPIFGEELTLIDVLQNTPLAICIGYELENDEKDMDIKLIENKLKKFLKPELKVGNFDFEYAAKEFPRENESQAGAFMIANEKFCSIFPH